MSEPRDVEHQLEEWGSDDQPSIDGVFANRLHTDLRELSLARGTVGRQRPIWQPAALALVAGLIVFAGVFTFTRDQSDEIELVMGASTQTEVVLPDGEVVPAETGLVLPDGTRINVGKDGSAVIADVVLLEGTQAVVNKGQLEILVDKGLTLSTSPQTVSTSAPVPTTRPPRDETTTVPPSTVTTTTSTDRTTSTTTSRPSTTSATTPEITAPPTSTDRTTTTVPDPVVELEWTEDGGRVRLSWTYVGPDTLAGWQVTVTNGDRTRTLAVLRDPGARTITVERIGDASVTYRVSARDSGGMIIVESNPVAVP